MPVQTIGQTKENISLYMDARNTEHRHLWFKTKPLDRTFCNRVIELQLSTISKDQGWANDPAAGSWSWFDVAILPHADASEPVIINDNKLVWRSHGNMMLKEDEPAHKQFGMVFDRRHDLLNLLQPGNVIAVYACVRFAAWRNDAYEGELFANLIDQDLWSPYKAWRLSSMDSMGEESLGSGLYTLSSTQPMLICANSYTVQSQLWFATRELDEETIKRIESIQLWTNSRQQEYVDDPESGSWSWFDIMILEDGSSTEPKVKDGRSLVWLSHTNAPYKDCIGQATHADFNGNIFNRAHEMIKLLEPKNVIAVRACAQYSGWVNDAREGRLMIRISNEARGDPGAYKPFGGWKTAAETGEALKKALDKYLSLMHTRYQGVEFPESAKLGELIRGDTEDQSGLRPLRLLSLDGGGVRGISSLHILKRIMKEASGDENTLPCDYFDMISGTSTGGLIAIMLGRLRMSVDECIKAYNNISETVFNSTPVQKKARLASHGFQYDHTILERKIKEIVLDKLKDANAKMLNNDSDGCKVFVVACRPDNLNNAYPTLMRTYYNKLFPDSHCNYAIWEAARATSAAPTYFESIKLGPWEYVDGGLGLNNPIMMLLAEARHYFHPTRKYGCVISIGTGHVPNIHIPTVERPNGSEPTGWRGKVYDVVKKPGEVVGNLKGLFTLQDALVNLVFNTEQAHLACEYFLHNEKYFRFNVGIRIPSKHDVEHFEPNWFQKLEGYRSATIETWTDADWEDLAMSLDDWQKMRELVDLTEKYLDDPYVKTRVATCASDLKSAQTEKKHVS